MVLTIEKHLICYLGMILVMKVLFLSVHFCFTCLNIYVQYFSEYHNSELFHKCNVFLYLKTWSLIVANGANNFIYILKKTHYSSSEINLLEIAMQWKWWNEIMWIAASNLWMCIQIFTGGFFSSPRALESTHQVKWTDLLILVSSRLFHFLHCSI